MSLPADVQTDVLAPGSVFANSIYTEYDQCIFAKVKMKQKREVKSLQKEDSTDVSVLRDRQLEQPYVMNIEYSCLIVRYIETSSGDTIKRVQLNIAYCDHGTGFVMITNRITWHC